MACRQMRLPQPAIAIISIAKFGQAKPQQPIWMSNVRCNGTEQHLDQCQHSGWGIHECDHDFDIGVACNVTGELAAWHAGTSVCNLDGCVIGKQVCRVQRSLVCNTFRANRIELNRRCPLLTSSPTEAGQYNEQVLWPPDHGCERRLGQGKQSSTLSSP